MGKTFGSHDFTCPSGEDWERTLVKKDAAGTAIDLTGRSYKMYVKENVWDADADALITLATSDVTIAGSPGVGITNNGTAGVVLDISGEDTLGWNYPNAVYDFWEKDLAGSWKKKADGKFAIPLSKTPTY